MTIKNLKICMRRLVGNITGQDVWKHIGFDVDVVAFDVFDTLIYREGILFPSDVYDLVGDSIGISNFKYIRINAEHKARDSASGKEREVLIEEIYDVLAREMGWNRDYSNKVKNKEIEIELNACKADENMKRFYNSVLQKGKKVVIISDMYLDKATLEKILKKQGYNLNKVDLYVSSEYRCSKRSGELYRKAIDKLNVNADRVIMIGDNFISDYLIPKKIGMQTMLYRRR